MANKWKDVWNNRNANADFINSAEDEFAVYSKLKEFDGFDVEVDDRTAYYRSFYDSALSLWERIQEKVDISSVYEAGCGSGANLYLLKNRGIKVGGIDYSENLANAARKILGLDGNFISIGEAASIAADEKWDVLLSDSVFAYFPDEAYGQTLLERMYEKAQKAVVILEIFDKSLQDECERYRRESMKDYDKKYEGLDKVFYSREMFEQFAKSRNCKIEFGSVDNPYYWNSRYLYNCILYKE